METKMTSSAKIKTSLAILALFCLALAPSSCVQRDKNTTTVIPESTKKMDYGFFNGSVDLRVINVDSCEYVLLRYDMYNANIIHKQNCKFCKNRKKN